MNCVSSDMYGGTVDITLGDTKHQYSLSEVPGDIPKRREVWSFCLRSKG